MLLVIASLGEARVARHPARAALRSWVVCPRSPQPVRLKSLWAWFLRESAEPFQQRETILEMTPSWSQLLNTTPMITSLRRAIPIHSRPAQPRRLGTEPLYRKKTTWRRLLLEATAPMRNRSHASLAIRLHRRARTPCELSADSMWLPGEEA